MTTLKRLGGGLLLLGVLGLASPQAVGQDQEASLHDLNMEVTALQMIHHLQLSREQMTVLKKLARETADKQPGRVVAKNNEKIRAALTGLRDALLKPEKDERILDLLEKLEEIRDKEKFDIPDDLEITEEARTQAPRVLRMLSARQVAIYAGSLADELPDPLENILDALGRARGLDTAKWKELRGIISEETGRLLAGLDADKADDIGSKVIQLLIVARGLSEDEFKKQQPELEMKARDIVGNVGPTDVIRNVLEHHLAELLSNHRLAAALDARLAQARK